MYRFCFLSFDYCAAMSGNWVKYIRKYIIAWQFFGKSQIIPKPKGFLKANQKVNVLLLLTIRFFINKRLYKIILIITNMS